MESKLKRINTPRKSNEEGDPKTPAKITLRRSTRSLEKRNKSIENEDPQTPKTSLNQRRSTRILEKRVKSVEKVDQISEDVKREEKVMDFEAMDEQNDELSTNYFKENPDIHGHGKEMFSFRTPKKKGSMVALAYNTPKMLSQLQNIGTPKTPRTPKSARKLIQPKTPSHVRSKLQKGN